MRVVYCHMKDRNVHLLGRQWFVVCLDYTIGVSHNSNGTSIRHVTRELYSDEADIARSECVRLTRLGSVELEFSK